MRYLVSVSVHYNGTDTFTLQWNKKVKVFRGTPEGFAKFLQNIKATDSVTTPRSSRGVTYMQIVNGIIDGSHSSVWAWSSNLEAMDNFAYSEACNAKEVFSIPVSFKMPETGLLLEKGDRVLILSSTSFHFGSPNQFENFFKIKIEQFFRSERRSFPWFQLKTVYSGFNTDWEPSDFEVRFRLLLAIDDEVLIGQTDYTKVLKEQDEMEIKLIYSPSDRKGIMFWHFKDERYKDTDEVPLSDDPKSIDDAIIKAIKRAQESRLFVYD